MTPLTEEEKKKKGELPSSVSGNVIASPQASMQAPAKPQGILDGVSVGASRPAIYDGQPATGNIYAQAGQQTPQQDVAGNFEQTGTPVEAGSVWKTVGNALTYNSDVAAAQQKVAQAAAQPAAQATPVAATPAIASYSNEGRAFSAPNSNPVAIAPEYPNITPTNLSAANASMAKANQIRQSMIDSQSAIDQTKGPSGGIIEDVNKKDREALFAKWDRENMVKQVANMNPRNAAAVAALLGSGDRAASEQAQTNAVRRGQDFTRESQSANAAVANREVSNRERGTSSVAGLQEAQSKGIMAGVENQAHINALQQKAAAGDKGALEALRAIKGKGVDGGFRGLHAAGGTSIDPTTGQVVKSPDSIVLYNEQTGQVQQVGNGQQAAPSGADKIKADMKAGKISRDEALKQLQSLGFK